MKKISHVLSRLIAWLNERDGATTGGFTNLREWADRPTHHPDCATCS